MGNKSSRPKHGKNGFFQSVWRPRQSASSLPAADDASNADGSTRRPPDPAVNSAKIPDPGLGPRPDPTAGDIAAAPKPDPDPGTAAAAADDPDPEPDPERGPDDAAVASVPDSSPSPSPEPEPEHEPDPAPAPDPAPTPSTTTSEVENSPQEQIAVESELPPTENDEPATTTTTTATELIDDPDKLRRPFHMKRVSSAGLEADTVLGRKTACIKEVYNLGRKLGQGQFGTTFLSVEKATGKEYACKSIAKRKLVTIDDVEDVRREIQIMHHLAGHPNVIQIVGAYEDALAVHVVMDLCLGGELFDRIIERGHYTEKKAAELARVIVKVVETCHSLGVMHRDLKPENFLFVNHDEDALLKTIDFGLSIFFKPGEIFTDVVGSPYYVAPEVLRKQYGPECDVWSAGVIIYILLCGVPPFWDETEQGIFEQVLQGDPDFISEPWPSISSGAIDLLSRMLVKDPKERLTAHQVLCHPWLQVDGDAPDKPLDSAVISRLKQFSAMNKLKKMAIRIIAENLSEEEIAGLKQMFKSMDTDSSGQITLEELKCGLENVGANLQDSELIDLMQAADVDNSGSIDYGEFIAAMLHLNKIQKEDHLYTAFSYFDKDGSGYITSDELQQACEQFGLENVQLDEIIKEVDQDNDGRIDYSEFVAMMQDTGIAKKIKM